MKVILYMATSVDGYIAKSDDDTAWISETEWSSYSETIRKAGCLIVGHRTYDILTKQPEFTELKDVKLVVVSSKVFKTLAGNHSVAKSPKEALELFKDFDEVIVAGGGMLNSSFMREGLIDEIYLDVEPIILGKGINLFEDANFDTKLEILGSKNLSQNEIQIHYRVMK